MISWATYCLVGLVVCSYCALSESASNTSCPTWFYYSNTSHQCECGVSVGVQCNQQERKAEVMEHFCVTTAKQEGQYYVGGCPLSLLINQTSRTLSELPSDPGQLNDVMCGPYNRRGFLCGQCISGYGPVMKQFDLKCANCSILPVGLAVGLYLMIELVPSTLFSCVLSSFTLTSQLVLYLDMYFSVRYTAGKKSKNGTIQSWSFLLKQNGSTTRKEPEDEAN